MAKVVEHRPADGAGAASFVDEQECGPFGAWRHEHRFESITADTTRLTDHISYRVPYGPLGTLADHLFVRRQLTRMFRRRHAALARLFAPAAGAAVH